MIDRMLFNLENQDDSFIRNNIWMKECRFLLRESRSFRETQMLLVSNNSVFSSCRLCYNSVCFLKFKCIFFVFSSFFFYVLMNLFVLRLVMNLVMCMEAAMRNIQHVFIALCDLGVLFLFLFFFIIIFFLSRESRKAVNFILRHCTVDQSCKYFTSTKKYQTNNMFCSFTTNKKSSSLLFSCVLLVLLFYFYLFQRWFVSHFPFSGKTRLFDSEQTIYLFYFKVKIIQKKLQKLIQKYMNSYKVILRTHFIYFLCSLSPQKTLESG